MAGIFVYGKHGDRIAFTYLKTNRDGLPARLELPMWVYDAGRAEQIINWVRGEVAIGGGYPYVIETADQVAVHHPSAQPPAELCRVRHPGRHDAGKLSPLSGQRHPPRSGVWASAGAADAAVGEKPVWRRAAQVC